MVASGIPSEITFLLIPVALAIGGIWYLGWNAVKSFYADEQGTIASRAADQD